MKGIVCVALLLMVSGAYSGEFVPTYRAVGFSRDHALAVSCTNHLYAICHTGRTDWAVETYRTIPVKTGDHFAYSVRIPALTQGYVNLSVMLKHADGSFSWGYGLARANEASTLRTEFLIPPGGVAITPRVTGSGRANLSVTDLNLERLTPLALPDLPVSWNLESPELAVAIFRDQARFAVTDKRTGRAWTSLTNDVFTPPTWRATRVTHKPHALELELLDLNTLKRYHATYQLEHAELAVTLSGEGALNHTCAFPSPLATSDHDFLILPMSEGFRLPVAERQPFLWNLAAWSSSMSMPFFGIEDGRNGSGYSVILETPNDAQMLLVRAPRGKTLSLMPGWAPERGAWGYTRRARYVFQAQGGYVAMAKRYRDVARAEGLVKTFAEKVRTRPNIDRLLGAANVWYFPSRKEPGAVTMAKELQASGLTRFLWSSGGGADTVRQIAALPDVLIGRYDCYRDVYRPEMYPAMGRKNPPPPTNEICANTSAWPNDVIWNKADDSNSWRKAWGVWDKTGTNKIYCATQCALKKIARERRNVSRELEKVPFTARFIDVTTSVGWEECENPAHPMTRTQCRAAKCELLGLLGRDFGLVVGSEQGLGGAVPYCDYFEGMMSPGGCRMPHGRPGAGRYEIFRDTPVPQVTATSNELARVMKYDTDGRYRIPLFELVFHDCCCSHWYWYDYSNRPVSLWRKRDLLNVLYGTAPMYIFDYRHWQENKAQFLASYNLISPVARRTGYAELCNHQILNAERTLQRSTFADGTIVTVNFADTPVTYEGLTLPPLGVHVTP